MTLSFNSGLVHICQFRVYFCVRLMPRSFCHFTVFACPAPMIGSDILHDPSVFDLFCIARSNRPDV